MAWARACPLTPSQGPLIRLTFLQEKEAIALTFWALAIPEDEGEIKSTVSFTDSIETNPRLFWKYH